MSIDLANSEIWLSLLTLTILEIVLGIDNVIFVSITADRLPSPARERARRIGLLLALVARLVLLASIAWIVGLTGEILRIGDFVLSWRDVILIAGGLFLLAKGTSEIHDTVEGGGHRGPKSGAASFGIVIGQIVVLDIVFSLDSVVTAVGMTTHLPVMIAAVVIAMVVMILAAGSIAGFIARHPTVKMLALSFLLMIGLALIADGLHFHIPKGYLYFAMAFSIAVEALNMAARRRRKRSV